LIALLIAAAALAPAQADFALVLDGARASAGLRAFLAEAGRHAPSLAPESVGRSLHASIGVDLLHEQPAWGLSKKGARAMVFISHAAGLSAPLADAKAARRALYAWLQSPDRAGKIAGGRLLTASGRNAKALLAMLERRKPMRPGRGPVWLYARLAEPFRSALLSIDASAQGLTARGNVAADGDVLAGGAPAPCEGAPMGCLRAGLGPAGRAALAVALRAFGRDAPPAEAQRVAIALEGIDARLLTNESSWRAGLRFSTAFDGPPAPGPALAGQLDLTAVDGELAKLSPLDALRGSVAAGAFAAHLLYGALLRHAGPLTLTGDGDRIELRLPLNSP
jgi:hypothetical protein